MDTSVFPVPRRRMDGAGASVKQQYLFCYKLALIIGSFVADFLHTFGPSGVCAPAQ